MSMSTTKKHTVDDLQAIADRIVAQAKGDEQIEVHVSRSNDTDIRVYQGELEHFVSSQSAGVSVRVIKDGKTGTSHAGTLDESALREVLAEARGNATFAGFDEWAGLAEPDGVPVVPQELWDDVLAAYPTEKKIDIAMELERLAVGVHGDELDAAHPGLDHAVDGVAATAAHAHHAHDGVVLGALGRCGEQVGGGLGLQALAAIAAGAAEEVGQRPLAHGLALAHDASLRAGGSDCGASCLLRMRSRSSVHRPSRSSTSRAT